ncbi:hypothetical protein HGA92_03385 [Candidatus Gracilibacteria bacterium]|nr:hypothetical protein [Candidatus Gracilibacteria bacterium]NUJ99140.1 hypothetical protein [Candidatus Gracilibacteria bacterium]
MQIYNNNSGKLSQVKELGFNLEKDMQSLTEANLENIFGLEFIKTEFQLNNLRIDSLAFDNETNSFVIIEYKRGNSYSVIDQGMSYLALMLNNKADFTQELGRKRKEFIDVKDIDWSQSRVIIIADSFNRYQRESINFKDLAIELWELKQFSNGVVVFNPIKASNTTESIKTVTKFETDEFEKVNKEIKTYEIDDLIKPNWEYTRELYEDLRDFILSLDNNLKENITKFYAGYRKNIQNLVGLNFYKSGIAITFVSLHKEDLDDHKDMIKNIPEERGWGKKSTLMVKDKDDLFYAKELIREAYKKYNG